MEYNDGKGEVACHGQHAAHCVNANPFGLSRATKVCIVDAMSRNPNIKSAAIWQSLQGWLSIH